MTRPTDVLYEDLCLQAPKNCILSACSSTSEEVSFQEWIWTKPGQTDPSGERTTEPLLETNFPKVLVFLTWQIGSCKDHEDGDPAGVAYGAGRRRAGVQQPPCTGNYQAGEKSFVWRPFKTICRLSSVGVLVFFQASDCLSNYSPFCVEGFCKLV